MKMCKYILIIFLSLILSSCGGMWQAGRSLLGINTTKENQTSSSRSANSGNGAGRDIKAKVNINAGDNKSKTFDNSNIRTKDLNSDTAINQNSNATNFGGTHTNNNNQKTISTTEKDNKTQNYNGQNITIHKNSIVDEVFEFIFNNLTGVLYVFFYYLGWRMHIFMVNRDHKKNKKRSLKK